MEDLSQVSPALLDDVEDAIAALVKLGLAVLDFAVERDGGVTLSNVDPERFASLTHPDSAPLQSDGAASSDETGHAS